MLMPEGYGSVQSVDTFVSRKAEDEARAVFRNFYNIPASMGGAQLKFDPRSQVLFTAWLADLEKKVNTEQRGMVAAHLGKFRSLLPALALLFHLIENHDRLSKITAAQVPVSKETFTMALA